MAKAKSTPEQVLSLLRRTKVERVSLMRGLSSCKNRHKRPIASHSERVFVRAKLLDSLAPKPHQFCARTNEPC
jgi:hypothetical protein